MMLLHAIIEQESTSAEHHYIRPLNVNVACKRKCIPQIKSTKRVYFSLSAHSIPILSAAGGGRVENKYKKRDGWSHMRREQLYIVGIERRS